MVAHNSELVAPAELGFVLGSLERKMARQDRRHRSALRRLRPQRRAHGVITIRNWAAEFLRRLFSEQVVMVSRDYSPGDRLGGAETFLDPAVRQWRRYLAGQSAKGCRSTSSIPAHGKKAACWSPAPSPLPWLDRVASSQRVESFYQLAALARGTDGGSARRRQVNDSLRMDIPKNELRPDGPTQRRREVHGDLEGGMDGRRAHAESSQSSAGEERWQALDRMRSRMDNRSSSLKDWYFVQERARDRRGR